MLYHLDISIHVRPSREVFTRRVQLAGLSYVTLQPQPAEQSLPLPVSFEEAVARLERLPRMFVEPDGAFVWVGASGTPRWQLDGCLYDRERRVVHIDVSGSCCSSRFDQLLRTCDWPDTPLMFRLPRHGVFLDEQELRRYVSRGVAKDE